MVDNIGFWLTLLVLIISALGTILPILPGLPVMAVAIIIYGLWEGFQQVNGVLIIVTLLLTGIGTLLDYLSGPYTAKKTGASKWGIWGAVIGSILGIFVLGPIGIILGPFIGAFIGELLGGEQVNQATKVGLASVLGTLLGSLLKFIFALIILALFIIRGLQ